MPISMIDQVMGFIERKALAYPLYSTRVQAGYPAPAEDVPAERFDLMDHLVPNPPATFFVRVAGDSMTGAGIFSNDLLIVDKSLKPKSGDVVVAVINGEFTVKRLMIKGKKIELKPENSKFATIKITDEADLNVWGVVKNVIHSV